MTRRKAVVAGASVLGAVVLVLAIIAVTLVVPSSRISRRQDELTSLHGGRPRGHDTTPRVARCPLTDEPAPGAKVPARPAIGIKIGNDPASRPQSGLQDADIVYEEMAEGGVTRYLAIFQCKEAPVIGPVRSVRWDDWHVLASYGHPILAFSGGIDQWNALVANLKWLYDANATFYPMADAFYRTTDRVPPWNEYTSSGALYKLDPSNHTPPPRQFDYSPSPTASSAAVVSATVLDFAAGSDVVWRWSAKNQVFERYYGDQRDVDAEGQQLHAKNVVIQMVETQPGPYAETADIPDVESLTAGSGTVYLLRNGRLEKGTWSSPDYGDLTRLRLENGKTMRLDPGNTWVEVVPVTYAVQFQKRS